jgi:hypothetical protein
MFFGGSFAAGQQYISSSSPCLTVTCYVDSLPCGLSTSHNRSVWQHQPCHAAASPGLSPAGTRPPWGPPAGQLPCGRCRQQCAPGCQPRLLDQSPTTTSSSSSSTQQGSKPGDKPKSENTLARQQRHSTHQLLKIDASQHDAVCASPDLNTDWFLVTAGQPLRDQRQHFAVQASPALHSCS